MRPTIRMLCLLILTILTAGAVSAQSTPDLVGVVWQWTHFADGAGEMDIETPENYTIAFQDDGTLYLQADCNQGSATYTAEEGAITITPGPMTLVACPEGSLDTAFVGYLSQVVIYSFTDTGELLLELPADSGTLTFTAQPQVTGTVTYLQRIALPDDAIVRVQIQDITVMDAPTNIIGEQVFRTNGAQVPFSFAVRYSTDDIIENGRYSISAQITDGEGNLLFISDSVMLVITGDHPISDVELVLVQIQRD